MGLFSRKTTEEIQEENRLLRERNIAREIEQDEKAQDKAIRKQAVRENRAYKNPKKIKFVKAVGSSAKDLGKGIKWAVNKAGDQYAKAEASKNKPKRVRKVKRSSGKRKVKRTVKRVRRIKRSSYASQFGLMPKF